MGKLKRVMSGVFATRNLLTVLGAAALLATVSAGAQMVQTSTPYSGTTTNPCNNETVNFSGTMRRHEKTQVSSDGRIHFVANNNLTASGTGSFGHRYSINATMTTNSKFPYFPIAFRQRSKFISSTGAPNFHLTVAYHLNGAGIQTSATTTSDCNG